MVKRITCLSLVVGLVVTAGLTASTTVALPAQAAARAQVARPLNLNVLVGDWINVNRGTPGIVQIDIVRTPIGFRAHTFGACHPVPCNWGWRPVAGPYPGRVTYVFPFEVDTLTIWRVPAFRPLLVVRDQVHFTVPGGRRDYASVDYFTK